MLICTCAHCTNSQGALHSLLYCQVFVSVKNVGRGTWFPHFVPQHLCSASDCRTVLVFLAGFIVKCASTCLRLQWSLVPKQWHFCSHLACSCVTMLTSGAAYGMGVSWAAEKQRLSKGCSFSLLARLLWNSCASFESHPYPLMCDSTFPFVCLRECVRVQILLQDILREVSRSSPSPSSLHFFFFFLSDQNCKVLDKLHVL